MREPNLSILFKAEPSWGFRGDPYLWADMKAYFKKIEQPANGEEFRQVVFKAFKELTGEELEPFKWYHVKKYAHGGMTSGGIHGYHWYCSLLPELTERFLAYMYNPKSVRVVTDHTHHRKITAEEGNAKNLLLRKANAVGLYQLSGKKMIDKEYSELADYIESIKDRNLDEVQFELQAQLMSLGD